MIPDLVYEEGLWVPKLIAVIVIAIVFTVLAMVIKKLIARASEKFNMDTHLQTLLARTSQACLIILAVITVLGTLGIDVSALVAGLGLTGFALGFALKDTISNLLSGFLILLYHPFEIGNKIRVSGFEGTVVSIDLRYTELDSGGDKILIPNAKLFTDPITVLR
ncbi:MAG: mechanosensitive ion channel domain-containing protein [Candidatus Hydrogenedentota bacterium]